MLSAVVAGGAVSGASSVASAVASQLVLHLWNGHFNPNYKKEDRKRMRYIQQKYSLAYGGKFSSEDPRTLVEKNDPNSRLLMSNGLKPANPFPDEQSFEESLHTNFYPVSGHQGRFVASHAMACIGVINDYQSQRRRRAWVPGVSTPGKPNDYINMFLEETKTWMRNQMTLDSVQADELARRDNYYTKLKHDSYFWCFPPEASESRSLHKVIDFVHDKVKNAYEVVSREEKNKSLQSFFKELNDHTTNTFEFGKQFLVYLLYPTKKVGDGLPASVAFDGRSYETGKLHRLLESTTDLVFESYVEDMNQTYERTKQPQIGGISNSNSNYNSLNTVDRDHHDSSRLTITTENNNNNTAYDNNNCMVVVATASDSDSSDNNNNNNNSCYLVVISEFEESSFSGAVYLIELCDPVAHRWIVRKTYSECEALHKLICSDARLNNIIMSEEELNFPAKLNGIKVFRDKEEHHVMCKYLQRYFIQLLSLLASLSSTSREHVCKFMEVKQLMLQNLSSATSIQNKGQLRRAEAVPNVFISLKRDFAAMLVAKSNGSNNSTTSDTESSSSSSNMSKSMIELRKVWGIDMTMKIFEAYALLQRMAALLGWTLEINHFFVSMFGNTLTFSKLPLRDILLTLKDILSRFYFLSKELFQFACQVNADSKYKWHKNLQMTENLLSRVEFHTEKAISVITMIDAEHLDYEAQLRRLKDVHARFQPLMSRIDANLISIQKELSLPSITSNSNSAITVAKNTVISSQQQQQGGGGVDRGRSCKYENDRNNKSGVLMLNNGDNKDGMVDEKYKYNITNTSSSSKCITSNRVEELMDEKAEEGSSSNSSDPNEKVIESVNPLKDDDDYSNIKRNSIHATATTGNMDYKSSPADYKDNDCDDDGVKRSEEESQNAA